MKYTITSILITLALSSCSFNADLKTYDLGIKNVILIDEQGDLKMNTYDVYIQKDTIAEIIYTNTPKRITAKKELDATGKFMLPGFWDNHTHFRGGTALIEQNERFLPQFISHGITTVRDAGGDLTSHVLLWNQEIQSGSRTGPTIFTSGPKLDGQKARWAGSLEVTNAQEITKALDSLQSIPVDYVKLYDSTISGELYLEIIRQAQARDMITSGHMPFTVTLDQAIDAGLDNVEHLYYILKGCSSQEKEITAQIKRGELGFWSSMAALIETYDDTVAQATFKKLRDHNVFVTPTLHIGDVLSYMDEVDHTGDTYLKSLDPVFIATYEGRNRSALNASPEAKQNRKDLQQFFLRLTKSLQEAGVSLLAGSDSGAYNSYTYPGPSLHGELSQMVKAGLTPQQALKTMYAGAQFLQKEGYKLAPGHKADLVILNSNPLLEITNTLDIHQVIKGGRLYD